MADIKKQIYENYYPKMHGAQVQAGRSDLRSYFLWLDHKVGRYLHGLDKDARILDLGCGTGDFLEYLSSRGFNNISGIDLSPGQIEIARTRGFSVESADALEYLNSSGVSYDLITAFDFIEHLTLDESSALLESLKHRLKPGGQLTLLTPNGEGLHFGHAVYGDLTHQTVFTPRSLRDLLVLKGFTRIQFMECGPVPKNLQGAVRVVLWKMIRAAANFTRLVEVGVTQEIWTESLICVSVRDDD